MKWDVEVVREMESWPSPMTDQQWEIVKAMVADPALIPENTEQAVRFFMNDADTWEAKATAWEARYQAERFWLVWHGFLLGVLLMSVAGALGATP